MSCDTRHSFGEAVAGRRNERADDVRYLAQAESDFAEPKSFDKDARIRDEPHSLVLQRVRWAGSAVY